MEAHMLHFHRADLLHAEGAAQTASKDAYFEAVKAHLRKKFLALFNQMDAKDDISYCNTEIHSDLHKLIRRVEADPEGGFYVWFTVNTAVCSPTAEDVENFALRVVNALKTNYFRSPVYQRIELHTANGKHMHSHVLAKSSGKSAKDIKKHLLTKKMAKKLGVSVESIQVGDARGKILFKKGDKFPYIMGEKVDDKKPHVHADYEYFERIGCDQTWLWRADEADVTTDSGSADDTAGADGLVAPAAAAASPPSSPDLPRPRDFPENHFSDSASDVGGVEWDADEGPSD